jgi:hypothetical protein
MPTSPLDHFREDLTVDARRTRDLHLAAVGAS